MIYNHEYIPMSIGIPEPPTHSIQASHPNQIEAWVATQANNNIQLSPGVISGERHMRAYGFGSQSWNSVSMGSLLPGWIPNISEQTQARNALLQDINDLVSCLILIYWFMT
jgi:hypothetical protein